MSTPFRTHTCAMLHDKLCGQSITVCGWVRRYRDHGKVFFVDLADQDKILQIIFLEEEGIIFQKARDLKSEYVIQVTGVLKTRAPGTENPKVMLGNLELIAKKLQVLNISESLPFPLDEHASVSEEVASHFRYLELRQAHHQARFRQRARTVSCIRHYLESQAFLEIETPILTRATPEGARDYLVPSRTYPGHYFALPQSPQLFKQLLMVAGFDRYYQVARCFRDEDLRADRQPEFTQLDLEMAFVNEQEVMSLVEALMRTVFKQILNVELPNPLPRMSYAQALREYGSDKPDLRIPLKLVDITALVKTVDFQVFAEAANSPTGGVVVLKLPGGADLSRKNLDDYTQFVIQKGAKGLAWLKYTAEGIQSPIAKFLPEEIIQNILEHTDAQVGDLLFFGAGPAQQVQSILGALRIKLGHDHQLVEGAWKFLWVTDFPLLEWDEDTQRWHAMHHPFTAPQDSSRLTQDPSQALARAYDLVLNGFEIGGGSIRIHDNVVQKQLFKLLNISEKEAEEKFGFLLNALKMGCPPHGGFAFGLDRLMMLMSGAQSIREVIAFPKTQSAQCPLTQAPSSVSAAQLRELGLSVARDLKKA